MNPEMDVPRAPAAGRGRRAEPITKRTSTSGTVTYEFRPDVGTKPDGSRDRRRFTYRTLAEAKRAYRRITSEVASGARIPRGPPSRSRKRATSGSPAVEGFVG